MSVTINQKISDFSTITMQGEIDSQSLFEQDCILFFYPKDNTSGCTVENNDFKALYHDFKAMNVNVFGVSKDSIKSHIKFSTAYDLPFDLISDESTELCQLFGVYKEKSMYGKKYMGVERSTFFIQKGGVLIK